MRHFDQGFTLTTGGREPADTSAQGITSLAPISKSHTAHFPLSVLVGSAFSMVNRASANSSGRLLVLTRTVFPSNDWRVGEG